ncbi:hypothetical protein EP7_000842 [Isosphaeraceae bacterium EP7]
MRFERGAAPYGMGPLIAAKEGWAWNPVRAGESSDIEYGPHTWYTEGTTAETFRNAETLDESRLGTDAAVREHNVNRITGLDDDPSARHWKR